MDGAAAVANPALQPRRHKGSAPVSPVGYAACEEERETGARGLRRRPFLAWWCWLHRQSTGHGTGNGTSRREGVTSRGVGRVAWRVRNRHSTAFFSGVSVVLCEPTKRPQRDASRPLRGLSHTSLPPNRDDRRRPPLRRASSRASSPRLARRSHANTTNSAPAEASRRRDRLSLSWAAAARPSSGPHRGRARPGSRAA